MVERRSILAKRRGNNEGTIYKRGNRWCAQVRVNGRRLTKYGATQGEVREWLKETIAQVDNGIAVTPDTLGEFLPSWLETVKSSIRLNTYKTYKAQTTHHLIPELGEIKLRDLRPDHIQRFYTTELETGISRSTLRLCHSVLHRALGDAVKWGLLTRNVCDAVTPPKAKQTEMSVWDADQVTQFLQTTQGHRWEALFYLAVTTGLRQSELMGLFWTDLDWDARKLHVQRQYYRGRLAELKRASSRRPIALGEVAIQKLRERQEIQACERESPSWEEQGFIFTGQRGNPISRSVLYQTFIRLVEEAGLPRIRFHDLRHTAATLMLKRGIHPKVVQERLGHANIGMTLNIYSHVLPSLQEDVADHFDDLFQLQ
jgi:integrase